MAAQKGRDFVLQTSDGASPPGFTQLGGQRETGWQIDGEMVPITNKDDAGIRTLLDGGGTSSLRMTCAGVYTDDDAFHTMMDRVKDRSLNEYRIVYADGDILEATMQCVSLVQDGPDADSVTYSATFESSGSWNYTRA